MKLFGFVEQLRDTAITKSKDKSQDFLEVIRTNPDIFAQIEHEITDKPFSEILNEIQLGLDLLNIHIEEVFTNADIIIIPPKYEFWQYLFLAMNFTRSGYRVKFAYHNWSKKLVDTITNYLNYLHYQNISFVDIEDLDEETLKTSQVLNLSDNFTKATKIPSFSTVLVTKDSDLDYAVAYILENSFSFAGMKVSNVKRVLVDEGLKEEFEKKLQSRMSALNEENSTRIRSAQMRQELHQLICESISDGADIFWGNSNLNVSGSLNLVLNNVTKSMRIYQKKFFGPVLLLSYLKINSKTLGSMIKQQPSKGIVIFTANTKFIDLNAIALRDFEVTLRPSNSGQEIIFEDKPELEILFKRLI